MRIVSFLLFALIVSGLAFDSSITAENKSRPTSFVGVPWGASREDTARILSARAGALAPDPLPDDPAKLELTGGTFSGQAVERWMLEFVNRRLAAASVVLKNDAPANNRYRDLRQQLTAKYGPPVRDGKPPLAASTEDKKERRTQQRTNPDQKLFGALTQWKFTPTLADKEPKTIELILGAPGGILATDEGHLVVTVRYVNEVFASPANRPASTPKPSAPDDL